MSDCTRSSTISEATTSSPPTITSTVSILTASPSSPTTELTNYTAAAPDQITTLPLNCPALNTESYKTTLGDRFEFFCDKDLEYLDRDGRFVGNIISFMTYTLNDCLEACSAMNRFQEGTVPCHVIAFRANITYMWNDVPFGGVLSTCWLKNVTAQTRPRPMDEMVVCAQLVNETESPLRA